MAFASPWAVAQPTFGFPQFHQFTPALPDVSQAAAMLAAAPGPYQELTRRLEIYKQKLAAQDGTLRSTVASFQKDEMQQLERDIQRALDQTKLEMDAIRQQAEQNQHDVEVWARQQQEAADALQQAQDEREHTALAPTGPDGYDDVYSSIMDKIASQAPHCAHLSERCLPWLTFAKRPLSVLELQEAMAISIDGNAGLSFEDSPAGVASVFSSCSGLAHLDCINGTSCIRLYDRTARDYLRRRLSRAEGDVGRGCIAYLLSRSDGGACKTDEDLVKRLRLSPLYDYAASYWGQHIQSISTPLLPHTVIRDFLSDRTRWEGALQAEHTAAQMRLRGLKQPCEDVSQYYPKRTEMIHLAARAGATNLITALLAQNYGSTIINARDHDGRTALSYAAQAGNDDTLEMLLANSLLDVDARDYQGGTPISHTADNGHASVVSRLLERSANPNWKDQDAVSPLWYAVQHGHVAVVRMLLECGQLSDLNPRHLWAPKSRLTPLSYALKNGFSEISELLARANGIDAHVDLWEHGSTILGLAIRNRYEGIALRLLTKYGIGRSSRNTNLGGELLVVAASIGRTKLVESLLVMHGVDPNATYPYNRQEEFGGLTPLMAAAKKGHGVVVKLLLSTEAIRPDASALSLAAQNGFRDIVDMLVADGRVEADHQDAKGRIPLSLAAEGAHEDVVEALLMNETVDPDCRDDEGRTPLSRATGTACDCPNNLLRTYKGVVRRLLADARVDPNSRDKEGNTPLYYAAKNGDVSLVEAILEHPRTDLGFGNKREALAAAASKGRVEVVGAFLKMGRFDVNALMAYPDECLGRTLLSLGAEGGHMGVVDLLLSQPGIEAHKRDTEGRTPLAMAAWGGRTAIVERLLAVEGADPNSRDIRGWTPLRMAVTRAYRSIDTVEALLRLERIDPDPADVEGRTPLSVVCEHANLELFDLLLAFGSVDPDSRDTAGRNPLSWAVERSFTEIDRQVEVIGRLLQIRAVDPNAEDAEGLTPLIRAIQSIHGSEFVRILLKREDLDVHQRSRDGRTPMAFARKMGDAAVVSLLRKRGALDEGKEPPVAVGHSEYSSSDNDSNMGGLRLPRKGEESVYSQTGLQRRRSSSSSASSLSSMHERDVDRTTKSRLRDKLYRKVILPLGVQQEHLDLVECNDADLCANCNTIDLDEAFSLRDADCSGRAIAELGRIDRTWEERECPMCQLIAAISPRWQVASGGDVGGGGGCGFALVAFSSTGTWLCHNLLVSWQHFTGRWIDTMFLGVVPYSMRDITKYDWKDDLASFVFKSGFIGRLGSNCEHRTRAITVTRIEDGVDFAVAKAWIACCREEHSRRCNPRTLARVPHFRLIDCTTRRVVRPGDQVPSYVALSYVWGLPPAASLGEESKLKPDVSDLPRDGFDIGESVEAVVEDAILVTLGLGYGFLWVDRYCILQKSDGKVKEEQLQNMDLVYANAEVTLVATAGQASSSGLPGVSSRCPRVPKPSVRIKGHVITLIPPDPALQIKSSTWMTRGWTCQEGLLTRRRLFFSESEMSFECRDLLTREAIRLPPDVQRQMGHLGRRLMEPSWIYGSLEMASSHKGGIDLFDLLAEYTRRKLAYQSDALNAMLGILQAYATRKRSPVYHVCGVPILRGSGNRFFERRHFGASNDGGSDNAEFALAGFIGALCWTLQSPGVRRPGFPSWSWTGWHNVVDFPPGEYRRITAFADGFDVEVSIVLADGVTPMPWSDYYGRLRNAAVKGIRFNPVFSQHHMLDITANIIIAQFYRRQVFCSNGMNWCGIACAGDDVCGGHLALTQSDSPPSSGDNEIGFVPSLRRRLLEESWLGIVLGHGGSMLYVLVLQEMPPSTIGATTHWERLGLLTIAQPTLKDEMLERRKLRLG
ncbi:HET domain-containing protein [Fusarium sp. Ph1]|nr:HET domain-containing protein [Fusarium sp. Ph1]